MIENRPWLTFLCHAILIASIAAVAFPLYIAFVASTHTAERMFEIPIPLLPGSELIHNYVTVMQHGVAGASTAPVGRMLLNSLVMALSVSIGKITISILSAFAIVYFRFPLKNFFFWMIFITLMLPVEVRILPTYKVVADLGLLDTYAGLTVPLIASATATFLFRQFFLTIPDELMEAARIDGASAMRFFWDVVLPLSKTNIAALFVILFIYGWNQYLWPLLVTTDARFTTVLITIKRLMTTTDDQPLYHLVMAIAVLAALPPVLVIVTMQRLFVKGLVDVEK